MFGENYYAYGNEDTSTSDDQDNPSLPNNQGKTTLNIYECTLNSFRDLSPYPMHVEIVGDSLARMMLVVLERAGPDWEATLDDTLADMLDLLLLTARDPFLDHAHYVNIIKHIPDLMRILMSGSTLLARQTCWELFDYMLASVERERLVAKAASDAIMVVMCELHLEESYIRRLYRTVVWLCRSAKRPDQFTDCYTLMRKLAAISERKKVDSILTPLFCDMFWDLQESQQLKAWAVVLPKFAEMIGPIATQQHLLELYLKLTQVTDKAVLGAGIEAAPLMTYMLSCAYEQATTPEEQERALLNIQQIIEWIKDFFEDPLGSWKDLSLCACNVIVPIMVTLRIPRIIKLETSHTDSIFVDCPLDLCKNSKCDSIVSGENYMAKSTGDASASHSLEVNASNSTDPELSEDELRWLKIQVFEPNANKNDFEIDEVSELDEYQVETRWQHANNEKYTCDDGSEGPLSLDKLNWVLFKIYWQNTGDIIDINIRLLLAHHITYLVRVFQGKYSLKIWLQIRNRFKSMATHSYYKLREAIASHLHELMLLLSDEIVAVDIMGLYYLMFNDEWEVKIAAYSKICEIIQQVSKEVLEFYLRWMAKISSGTVMPSQWRHRASLAHDFARCLPHYDIQLATKLMYQPIMRLLTDKIATVRAEAINAISLMLVLAWQTPEISLKSFVCDIVTQFGLSDQWLRRQTFAKIVESLLEWSTVARLEEGSRASLAAMLWEATAECAGDLVPNVRLVCARTLAPLTLEPDHILYKALATLKNDVDRDVRYFATDINWRRCDAADGPREEQQ